MPRNSASTLQKALDAMAPPGVLIGHRCLSEGDENALLPAEAISFVRSVLQVRRASGAVRIVARDLLARLGCAPCAIPKARSGAPVWPAGIIGSLSHDKDVAVAAIALDRNFGSIGIDVEPAEPLPPGLLGMVATPAEQARLTMNPCSGRLLFAAKEAVYKAVHPLDQIFLEHHDVEIDFANGRATVRYGRVVSLRIAVSTHLFALAFLPPQR
jgi:4'-phosphopantetheinyl transferase EntD